MLDLKQVINSPALNLKSLSQILHSSEIRINFLGSRIVSSSSFEGAIDLSRITKRLLNLSGYCTAFNPAFSLSERIFGIKCSEKLDNLYVTADKMLGKRNLLTRILAFIQELFNFKGDSYIWPYTNSFPINGGSCNYLKVEFSNLSTEEYKENFPNKRVKREFTFQGTHFFVNVPIT